MATSKKSDSEGEDKPKPIVIRNTTDLQRLKLEKLMQNPDKPVIIPERPKERGMPPVPDFVRNVMGSSAGAGSGEFHVYRHLRRKEYARQKYLKESAEKERLQAEYQKKLEDNKRAAEERTAKKRAKRLKKKEKQKHKKKLRPDKASSDSAGASEPSDASEEEGESEEYKGQSEEKFGNSEEENVKVNDGVNEGVEIVEQRGDECKKPQNDGNKNDNVSEGKRTDSTQENSDATGTADP